MKPCLILLTVLVIVPREARTATLFESGTLGPVGVSWDELTAQTVPGTNISQFAYNGVRFHLNEKVQSTHIGGHFVGPTDGTFFGAIITLEDGDDFPNSGDFSTPDVLGTTLLTFPVASQEVFGQLPLSLTPGWYAMVFGSGLFGADTDGGAVRNGADYDNVSYIAFQPRSALPWIDVSGEFNSHRFVLKGTVVPEPSIAILATALLIVLCFQRHFVL